MTASLGGSTAWGSWRGEAGVVGVVCGTGEDGRWSPARVRMPECWFDESGFFGEGTAVGHGMVLVGLTC